MIAAAITPRNHQGGAQVGAVLEVIDYLEKAGVDGIALLGSTGEFTSLDFDERVRLTYMAAKRSRVPLLVGTGSTTLDIAVELGRESAGAGAAGLLVMPPYYFRYDQADLAEYFRVFAEHVGSSVPLYLYNIPAFSSAIDASTAAELIESGLYSGIKDSSGSMDFLESMLSLKQRCSFTLLAGNDSISASARSRGADGVVSGVACAAPELMVGIERAVTSGDTAKLEWLEARLREFIAWIDGFPTPVGIRAAVACRGIDTGTLAVPLPPEKRQRLGEFTQWFAGWLEQVKRDAA